MESPQSARPDWTISQHDERLEIPLEGIDALIFDCDGTLVDSMPLHLQAWRESLAQYGFSPEQFTLEMHYGFAGMPGPAIVRILNEKFGCSLPPEEVEQAKVAWYLAHHHTVQPVRLMADYARSMAGKIPMAVASGSNAQLVEDSLILTGLDDLFPFVITPEQVKRGKPAPDMFLLAAHKLSVDPGRCLVFEDGQLGIDAAAAAGMKSVFLTP